MKKDTTNKDIINKNDNPKIHKKSNINLKNISTNFFTNILIVILSILAIMCTVESISHNVHPNCDIPNNSVNMNNNWYDKDGNAIVLSPLLSNKSIKFGKTNTIYYDITDAIKPGYSMCFRSLSTDFTAYIDGKEILKPTYYKSPFSCNSTGSQWHFYTFKESDIGKTIEVKIKFFYNDNASYFENVYACKAQDYVINAITSRLSELLIAIIIFTLGIFFIILGFYTKRVVQLDRSLLIVLGFLLSILSIWTILESHIVELLFNNSQIVHIMACNMLLLIPIPTVLFISHIIKSDHKYFINAVCILDLLLFILSWIFQLTGFQDFHDSLYLSFASIAISAIAVILYVIFEHKNIKNDTFKSQTFIKLLFVILIGVTGIIDFISFFNNPQNINGFFSRASSILVIVYCIFVALNNIVSIAIEFVHNNSIKEMAYTDSLTGVYNRASYEEKIQQLNNDIDNYTTIGIVVFDVNNLKYVNDTYGHKYGDELISSAAKTIKDSFTNSSSIYRIGGDEFTIIIESPDARQIYKESSITFKNYINNFNNFYNKKYTLSVAFGSAFYEKDADISLNEIIRFADKEMYKDKNEYKSLQNTK